MSWCWATSPDARQAASSHSALFDSLDICAGGTAFHRHRGGPGRRLSFARSARGGGSRGRGARRQWQGRRSLRRSLAVGFLVDLAFAVLAAVLEQSWQDPLVNRDLVGGQRLEARLQHFGFGEPNGHGHRFDHRALEHGRQRLELGFLTFANQAAVQGHVANGFTIFRVVPQHLKTEPLV
jgi:hypothetical protein